MTYIPSSNLSPNKGLHRNLKTNFRPIVPFFNEMRKRKVKKEDQQYSPIWDWFRKLENKVSKEDQKITTKEWRLLKGACK